MDISDQLLEKNETFLSFLFLHWRINVHSARIFYTPLAKIRFSKIPSSISRLNDKNSSTIPSFTETSGEIIEVNLSTR